MGQLRYVPTVTHDRAKNELKAIAPNEVNLDLMCDALEFLAHEYRYERMGTISVDERNKICSERYNRNFEVGLTGPKSIDTFGKEYKVKYKINFKGKPVEVPLDLHLKVGTDNMRLLRIYFLYDDDEDLIVVGSLPKHLRTVKEDL